MADGKACVSPLHGRELARLRGGARRAGFYVMAEAMIYKDCTAVRSFRVTRSVGLGFARGAGFSEGELHVEKCGEDGEGGESRAPQEFWARGAAVVEGGGDEFSGEED